MSKPKENQGVKFLSPAYWKALAIAKKILAANKKPLKFKEPK